MKTIALLMMALAVILVLLFGLALGTGSLGYGFPYGMMGSRGNYAYPVGMMGGWGWGMGGLLMMGLMFLVPLGFLALLVLGTVWLVRQATPPSAQPPVIGAVCPSCHKGLQADWKTCPYCEQKLK